MSDKVNELLSFNDVSMSYYDLNGEVLVFKNLSFTIKPNTINAIIGPSGCGKSTILDLVSGLSNPVSGVIKRPEKIGYMFQRDNLLDWLTILDNVLLGIKVMKLDLEQKKKEAIALLEKYGLKEYIYKYPSDLSGGMRQRVALIRVLLLEPDLLLLDEPFSALDAKTKIEVSIDIQRIIKKYGISTIIVTHDIGEAITLSDNIYVLTKKPSKIKKVYELKEFNMLDGYQRRKNELFIKYFNKIWDDMSE